MTWFWWIWNAVPWYVPVIIAIILVGVCWQFIAPIWALLPRPIKILIGFIGSIFVAVQYGRNRGQQSERDKRAEQNATAIKTRDKIDAKVQAMPDSDVDSALRRNKWMRDG